MRIIFVIDNLMAGGVVRALINFLNALEGKYEVDLLCFSQDGTLNKQIPKYVNILESNRYLQTLGETQRTTMNKSKLMGRIRFLLVVWSRLFTNKIPHRLMFNSYNKLEKEYDFAISYIQDNSEKSYARGCNRFVLERIKADKKIAFVHCDYENYGGNTPLNTKLYFKFDKVICVSDGCKRVFDKCVPNNNLTAVVRNSVNIKEIKYKSEICPIEFQNGEINIITVARLSPEKGITRAINAFFKAGGAESNCTWHIVGDGPERENVEDLVKRYNLKDRVILYGETDNPYRIMKNCDYLLLPSFHECAPMVFDEASILGLTILTTNTISTKEMVLESGHGYIYDNSDKGLEELFHDLLLGKLIVKKYETEDYNTISVNQFEKILKGL